MNSDVFISYDPSDASFVNQLCQALQASGLSTWVEGHDLPPASDRATALAEAIQASPLFLLIVSPAAAASTALADQLALAKGEGKIILSLLWQQTDLPPAWKLHLSGTQPLAFHGLASSENLARLTRLVIERLGQAALDQALVGLPPPVGPESLAVAEQAYRQRLKEKYAADAAYFIPLTGQTTEVGTAPAPESRAARRRRQRAQADLCQWVQAGQELRRVKLDSLAEAVDKYPCVILLGEPGSGKTTALEHLAYELVGPSPLQLRSGQAQPSPLPTLPPSYLPLPLRLSEFSPGLTVEEFIVQSWAGATTAGHWQAPELAANLTAYLEAGRLLILFDALNEMPHSADTPARSQALRRFITTWAATGNRFLVTCRVLDYGEALTGLQRVELQPLDDGQIQAFLLGEIASEDDRCAVLWQELSTTEDGDHRADLRERLNTELEDRGLQTKLQDFWLALTRGDDQRRLLELARNPYLLTVMVEIYAEDGRLGRNRAELMARFSQMLLEWAKRKCDPQEWLDEEVQQAALSITAFEMQARAGSGARVETGKVKSVMPQTVQPDPNWPPRPAPPDQVLTLAANAHILEMPVDRASVRFYHQLLQEYFAARELLTRMRPPSVPPSTLPRSSGRGPLGGRQDSLSQRERVAVRAAEAVSPQMEVHGVARWGGRVQPTPRRAGGRRPGRLGRRRRRPARPP